MQSFCKEFRTDFTLSGTGREQGMRVIQKIGVDFEKITLYRIINGGKGFFRKPEK